MASGWRSIIISHHESLELSNNQLLVKCEEGKQTFPLEQVRDLMVAHPSGSASFALLQRLAEEGVNVVLCDHRYEPSARLISIGGHMEAAGHLFDQVAWKQKKKDALWRQIVRRKIVMQAELLERLNSQEAKEIKKYAAEVRIGDSTNREGISAKVYFRALFGADFVRHAADATNAALNYGYTILNTSVSRAIAAHGYNTAIGVHHCNRQNYVNLSCDLMEPFRPLVDEIVVENINCELDWSYKKELISVLQRTCRLDGKEYKLGDALDIFILQGMDVMQGKRKKVGVVSFA